MTLSIGILGAGAWGTALATVAAQAGPEVILWARDQSHIEALIRLRENQRDLPGVALGSTIHPTAAIERLGGVDMLLAVVPAQSLREVLGLIAAVVQPGVPVVVCAKGIERQTGLLLGDVVRAVLPACPPAALSGPSFAIDVSRGLPTAVTLAAETLDAAAVIAERLGTPKLRLYHTDDLIGVEIGGAVKNVLAIACGIAQGRGLGPSAVAALMARAFAELMRFGRAHGARAETLMGLSGFGDLVLTCNSTQSRNFSLGLALGRGEDLASAGGGRLAEGVMTAPVLLAKARLLGVAMPIVESVDGILAGRLGVGEAIDALLARPFKAEE
jgi:glycerol-3-phosphate dehydrogenase (NAD(P)+)